LIFISCFNLSRLYDSENVGVDLQLILAPMGRRFTISVAILAATGSFLFGYDSGVLTDVIESPNFLEYFDTTQTSAIIGAINSTFSGGVKSHTSIPYPRNHIPQQSIAKERDADLFNVAVIGSLQGGLTMDRFGRKATIQLGAILCVIGATLQAAAQNLAMILAGRILAGWAIGLMSMSVPVYQAECAHPRSRGLIVGLSQQMIGIGFIVSTYEPCHNPGPIQNPKLTTRTLDG
jgi:MFS family permease